MNPFRPPSAPVEDAIRPKGSALKGFALGLLVDIGGTMVFGIVLSIVYAVLMSSEGQSEQQIKDALTNPESLSWVFIAELVGGTAFSLLGGYVCERISRRGSYQLGLTLGLASTALGVMMGGFNLSLSMNVLMALATIVAVLIGTQMAFDRRKT